MSMTYLAPHSFILARDVRPRDICRIPGTLNRGIVSRVIPTDDMTEIHWINNPPTQLGSNMNVVRFGRKTKIACAHHNSHA